MSSELPENTRAILLLAAPLIVVGGKPVADPLSPGKYNRLAQDLRVLGREPADLLRADVRDVLADRAQGWDCDRLAALLGRGFLLGLAVERWSARGIWVMSRADADYPRRLKERLGDQRPPVLYGCGDRGMLADGGLAVVGSRNVSEEVTKFTEDIGRLTAAAGRTLVSGGARGVDQVAMRGSLDATGGVAIGMLADGLERAATRRDRREQLRDERLVLVSPYDPATRFHVGNAMGRNKLIYALADAALVAQSDYDKGGAWTGAVEQLDRNRKLDRDRCVPVYVRNPGEADRGLRGLLDRGASVWPAPETPDALQQLLNDPPPETGPTTGRQPQETTTPTKAALPFGDKDDRLVDVVRVSHMGADEGCQS